MKNLVIVLLLGTTVVVGYIAATSNLRLSSFGREGKTATLARGDLTLPIRATGEVKPVRRIIVKAEASGEVIEVAKQPGERVRAGDLLIRLQRDDEQRNVNRAKLKVTVAKAALEEAKTALQQTRTADIATAEANIKQIRATLKLSKLRADRAVEEPKTFHEDERVQRSSNYQSQLAQLDSAKAAKLRAELAIPRAEQAVVRARASHQSAQNDLGDAEKQLAKTNIRSPIDGVLADILVQVGEVIQGGKLNLTGGTVLAYLLDQEELILQAEVDEADIGRVLALAPPWARPGHESTQRMPDIKQAIASLDHLATITVETFPEETFEGVIERIYPEPKTAVNVTTYLVDVVIVSENKHKLLPGMRAEVEFTSEFVENVVLCPNEAIRTGPSGKYGVYVKKKDVAQEEWPAEFVACRIGLSDGAFTELKEGVDDGTVVYTKLPAKPRKDKKDKDRQG